MMKIFSLFSIAAAFALLISCEKSMTEAERNAQVEAEVQQRLASERQATELAQQQADLDAREQALADKEAAATNKTTALTTPRATARPQATVDTRSRTSSAERGAERTYDTFYRKLEPHGAWRETADYGYVYQPKKAQQSRDWRPYTDGRWAYTDAGWTWVSDEPFGWATYHYGRWTRLRGVGWVWVPGDEWAPAWVSWRKSDEHVGWAPLPPEARFERGKGIKKWADSYYDIGADEYVFIPNEEIGSNEIRRAIVPVERNVTIVNQTTNVTNIIYSNTTVINEGPDYEELRGRSREPLRRLRIERQYEVEEDESPQATVRGEVIAMMTPLFSGRSSQRPRNVGAPIQQATVERNWATSGNQPEAERARQKMKAEATPPPDAPSKKYEKPDMAEGGSTPPAPAPTATPVATAAPAAAAPAATIAPTATPTATPAATIAATATPTATASATPRPTSTPAPTATATATPIATATPTARPVASPSIAPTASPTPEATMAATATPRTRRTMPPATVAPINSPTPAISVPPSGGAPEPGAPAGGAEDARQKNAAERAERLRQREDARNAKIREMAGSASPSAAPAATVAPTPVAVATPVVATPRVAPIATPASVADPLQAVPEATPASRKAPRLPPTTIPSPPSALTTPVPAVSAAPSAAEPSASPAAEASPTPGRRDKKPKRALEPGSDTDVPETPEATPAGADVP